MKFYIVRHGQTDWNNLGRIQGHIDNKLNASGQAQALEKAQFFNNIKPDLLITSRLKRAKETVNIIAEHHAWDVNHEINDEFIERNFGELDGTFADDYYLMSDFSIYPNFEQHDVLTKRSTSALKSYVNKDLNEVVIVSHSHTIRSIMIGLFPEKYSWEEFEKSKLPNLAVVEIEYDKATSSFTLGGIH